MLIAARQPNKEQIVAALAPSKQAPGTAGSAPKVRCRLLILGAFIVGLIGIVIAITEGKGREVLRKVITKSRPMSDSKNVFIVHIAINSQDIGSIFHVFHELFRQYGHNGGIQLHLTVREHRRHWFWDIYRWIWVEKFNFFLMPPPNEFGFHLPRRRFARILDTDSKNRSGSLLNVDSFPFVGKSRRTDKSRTNPSPLISMEVFDGSFQSRFSLSECFFDSLPVLTASSICDSNSLHGSFGTFFGGFGSLAHLASLNTSNGRVTENDDECEEMNPKAPPIPRILFMLFGFVLTYRGWWNLNFGRQDWRGFLTLLGGAGS